MIQPSPKTELEIVTVELLVLSVLQTGRLQEKGYAQWMYHHNPNRQTKSHKGP